MKYVQASSFAEAAAALAEFGEDAKAVAGGQSLVPIMNLRIAAPAALVDLTAAAKPSVQCEDEAVVISALTRHCDLERSEVLARRCPLVADAARCIGNVRVRNRGTIGGSFAHADPAAELPCVAVALDASITTISPRGERALPAADFFQSVFTTALAYDELVTQVRFPMFAPQTGWSFQEFARRVGDFALSAVAATVELDADRCRTARLAACAIADRPVRLVEVEALLTGAQPEAVLDKVQACAAAAVPEGGYRAHITGLLARRAVVEAVRRARPR